MLSDVRRNYSDVLHQTVDMGHFDIIKHLVKELKFDVNAYDVIGCTPLHCVPMNDPFGIAPLLIESGACIFAETLYDRETVTFGCEMEGDTSSPLYRYMKKMESELGEVNGGKIFAAFDFKKNELGSPKSAPAHTVEVEGKLIEKSERKSKIVEHGKF